MTNLTLKLLREFIEKANKLDRRGRWVLFTHERHPILRTLTSPLRYTLYRETRGKCRDCDHEEWARLLTVSHFATRHGLLVDFRDFMSLRPRYRICKFAIARGVEPIPQNKRITYTTRFKQQRRG